jgi:hypothetical protein
MAGPLAGISAAQIAQQKLPDQAAQQANKAGPSKFDNKMQTQGADKAHGVDKAQGVNQAQHVQHAQQIQKMEQARQVEQAGKIDKTNLQKTDKNVTGKGMDPVTQKSEVSKSTSMVMGMMDNMEKGGAAIDKLINGGLTGKNFSNSELLGLQAGMYKYTQELDLCSKVVEKATSGLKDTLKTQV